MQQQAAIDRYQFLAPGSVIGGVPLGIMSLGTRISVASSLRIGRPTAASKEVPGSTGDPKHVVLRIGRPVDRLAVPQANERTSAPSRATRTAPPGNTPCATAWRISDTTCRIRIQLSGAAGAGKERLPASASSLAARPKATV